MRDAWIGSHIIKFEKNNTYYQLGRRGQLTVNHTDTQTFINTISYLFAEKQWVFFLFSIGLYKFLVTVITSINYNQHRGKFDYLALSYHSKSLIFRAKGIIRKIN